MTILSSSPAFSANLALCRRWFATSGTNRCRKKSASLGWAGIFSGLALAKPQLLLLVPILFLARRAWRALAGFGAVIGAFGVVSVAAFGISPVLDYINSVGRWAIGGKLPTNTGWQPALPRIPHATPIVRAHLLDFADSK